MSQQVAIPTPRLPVRQRIHVKRHLMRAELWALPLATVVLASASVMLVVWNPRALLLALAVGLLAVGTRFMFPKVRSEAQPIVKMGATEQAATTTVATAGLALAMVVVVPLLLFVLLWAGLLGLLFLTWILHVVGLT